MWAPFRVLVFQEIINLSGAEGYPLGSRRSLEGEEVWAVWSPPKAQTKDSNSSCLVALHQTHHDMDPTASDYFTTK
jgi:hypothetical protein